MSDEQQAPRWQLALAELGRRIQELRNAIETEADDLVDDLVSKVEEAVEDFKVNIGWEPQPGDEPRDQGPPDPPPPDAGDGGGTVP